MKKKDPLAFLKSLKPGMEAFTSAQKPKDAKVKVLGILRDKEGLPQFCRIQYIGGQFDGEKVNATAVHLYPTLQSIKER